MEELLKHRLSFDDLWCLVENGIDKPFTIYYVKKTGSEGKAVLMSLGFDSQTTTDENSRRICSVLLLKADGEHWGQTRFGFIKSHWDKPQEDAGFLNYFHAYGYLQLVRARQRKEVAV